ncbi:MAG: hypothetical protein AB4911_21310 [Oscillochloridaceae bacterium umkhey_bin13]
MKRPITTYRMHRPRSEALSRTFPWQRSIRKLPEALQLKIAQIADDMVVVGGIKKIPSTDLANGIYVHLQMRLDGDRPVYPDEVVPDWNIGRYSRFNVDGSVTIRRDMPKTTKTISIETPNFGDWSRGSHTVDLARQVYRRDITDPAEQAIQIDMLDEEHGDVSVFVFRFRMCRMFSRSSPRFTDDLHAALNLLIENTGVFGDIYPTDASSEDYLRTLYVNWEILPVGKRDATIAQILNTLKNPSDEVRQRLLARYELLNSLKPISFIIGTNGFRRYFGARFSDSLVAFENIEYGNALYIMYDDWSDLSKLTRGALRATRRHGEDFVRVIHRTGWEAKVRLLITARRGEPLQN